jgi:hypothetical protein
VRRWQRRSRSRRRRVAAVLPSPRRAVSGAQLVLLTFPLPLPEFSTLAVNTLRASRGRPLLALQRTRCRLRLRWKYCSRVRFRSRQYEQHTLYRNPTGICSRVESRPGIRVSYQLLQVCSRIICS